MEQTGDVTVLLRAWSAGDRSVEDRLFELVVPELRRMAGNLMRGERADHSLQPTALLNEAYFRLANARERDWEGRKHFFAIAARAMRRLLIDHARGNRMGRAKVALADVEMWLGDRGPQLEQAVAMDALLDELERVEPGWCAVIELKFFLGLTDAEAAEALGLPLRTLQRQFGDARRWLFERIG